MRARYYWIHIVTYEYEVPKISSIYTMTKTQLQEQHIMTVRTCLSPRSLRVDGPHMLLSVNVVVVQAEDRKRPCRPLGASANTPTVRQRRSGCTEVLQCYGFWWKVAQFTRQVPSRQRKVLSQPLASHPYPLSLPSAP